MELIELHILQSFPVTCLNRDDLGSPKSALFGGVQRARVSSQCWKRAIRIHAREIQPAFGGTRTRYVIPMFRQALLVRGQTEVAAQTLAECLAAAVGKIDKVEQGNVKTLVYLSPQEIENVAGALLDQRVDDSVATLQSGGTESATKAAAKALAAAADKAIKALAHQVKDAADIAVFGRMVADDHTLSIDGAAMFSHALSTHRATNEVDFFSAVDDSKPAERDDAGAGHIGTTEFNSACYYRCAAVNLDLLRDYLSHLSSDELADVLSAFLRATVTAVPTARQNAMFGHSLPGYVLGLRRAGHPLSLVNAFEAPVRATSGGYLQPSAAALEAHYGQLKSTYSLSTQVETALPATTLAAFIDHLVSGTPDPATAAALTGHSAELAR